MFYLTNDIDRSVALMDVLRRRVDRIFDGFDHHPSGEHVRPRLFDEVDRLAARASWPALTVADEASTLVIRAEVPGLSEKDIQLSVHQDVLTVKGERKPDAPEGYFVHRRERSPGKFAKSFSLPCKVDPEKSTATVKNGVMTIRLAKALEAQPRQIAIRAS